MSSDQTLTRPDSAVSTNNDSANKILSEQTNSDIAGINNRTQVTADSAAMVASSQIPDLQISGLESTQMSETPAPASQENPIAEFFHDVGTVASDVGKGMLNELTQHPLEVLEAGAVGLGIGILTTAAAVVLAPEIVVAGIVVGASYGISQLIEHTPDFVHDALVVSNAEDYSAAEVAQAHSNIEDVGEGTALLLAGAAGGLASGLVSSAVESTVSNLVPKLGMTGLVDDVAPGVVSGETAAATEAGTSVASTVETAAATEAGTPLASTVETAAATEAGTPVASTVETAAATEAGTPVASTVETPSASVKVADSEVPSTASTEAPVKPQTAETAEPVVAAPMTVEQSVEINGNLFRASQDEIVPSVKQLYQVQFEKAGPGGQLVKTLENPAGVEVPEGQWIATRLNADGTPNMERGMVNTWTPSDKAILKGYKLTPEELAGNTNITGWTNTEAPPVHMVQLKEPIDIQTAWGPMHGDAGSWLANYDYNPATGAPGSSWAIVTEQSYAATYKPV